MWPHSKCNSYINIDFWTHFYLSHKGCMILCTIWLDFGPSWFLKEYQQGENRGQGQESQDFCLGNLQCHCHWVSGQTLSSCIYSLLRDKTWLLKFPNIPISRFINRFILISEQGYKRINERKNIMEYGALLFNLLHLIINGRQAGFLSFDPSFAFSLDGWWF